MDKGISLRAPSVQLLLLLYLLALTFVLGMGWPWPQDPDIWWHLKTGEWIVRHQAVPWADPFSASTAGSMWVAYSWLAEVLFYVVDRYQPVIGLHVLQACVVLATITTLLLHAHARSGSFRLALFLTTFILVPQAPWVARPQIFSFLFVALTMWLLWIWQQKKPFAAWLLPPLMCLWANIHVYFIVGLGLVALHVAAGWSRWVLNGRPAASPPAPKSIFILALCVLAPLVNPYGTHLYQEIAALTIHGTSGWAADSIRELASPSFHDWPMQVFFTWIFLGSIALLFSAKRPGSLTLLLFFGLLYQSLQHRRDVAYFSIVLLPIFAEHLAQLPAGRLHRIFSAGNAPFWRALPWPWAISHWLIGLGVLAVIITPLQRMLSAPENVTVAHRKTGLTGAVNYLLQHPAPGPLYNSLTWGGYLIYSLHPKYKVYIDNRTQLYSDAFWEKHNRIRYGKPDWHTLLDASGARIVLWERDEPLVSLLRLSPDWSLQYEDKDAAIFVRGKADQ